MHYTNSIEETKELSLSLNSDSMGVIIDKRLSLHSDKHGGVKVKFLALYFHLYFSHLPLLPVWVLSLKIKHSCAVPLAVIPAGSDSG